MPRNRRSNNKKKNSTRAMVMQVQRPLTASNPGRTRIRVSGECLNVDTAIPSSRFLTLAYTDFNTWSGRLRAVLLPFENFRVVDLALQVFVAGGAASPYTIYSCASMGILSDTSVTAILDDDAALVATAGKPGSLHLDQEYWRNRSVPWYVASDSSSVPSTQKTAGSIAYYAVGGTTGQVVGHFIADVTMEYHTLT